MPHPTHRRSPKTPGNADLLKMLFETAEFENKSDLCKYCFKKKPQEDPDDEDVIYCSKKCAIAHAFVTLSGEEYEETVEEEKVEEVGEERVEEEEEEESTGPLTPKEIPVEESEGGENGDGEESASSRLCLRLVELGKDEDDLTIENLLATLEEDDKDSSEDSERSSSRSLSSARPRSVTLDYDRPTLDLFKYAIRRSLALSTGEQCANRSVLESTIEESLEYVPPSEEEQDAVPTSSTGLARDDVVPTGSENNSIEALDRSRTFGLASRLRKALNKVGSASKRNSDIKKLSGIRNSVGVLEAPTRRSQLVTPMPSGDEWNDFVGILQFMEKAGLGGSTGKPSW